MTPAMRSSCSATKLPSDYLSQARSCLFSGRPLGAISQLTGCSWNRVVFTDRTNSADPLNVDACCCISPQVLCTNSDTLGDREAKIANRRCCTSNFPAAAVLHNEDCVEDTKSHHVLETYTLSKYGFSHLVRRVCLLQRRHEGGEGSSQPGSIAHSTPVAAS
jgi:hypothetical protein